MTAAGRSELLAPAGEPRALRAALAAGADAVYFGLERWSARAFAGNFAGETAVAAVETAHLYDARAYLALNTLLKDHAVEPALAALEAPYLAGLDALIVADLGFAACVRELYSDLPLHASTQLNTHSSSQLAALAKLGFTRAILARELSLLEIAALDPHGLELEAFIHGALCYGYSGDCLLASMVGGRSGNRGRCSQSCRLRYDLRRLGDRPAHVAAGTAPSIAGGHGGAAAGHPVATDRTAEPTRVMSTSDLAAIGVLPRLLAAGVTSFKIEGRMKDAAYVGVTTAVYREALDAACADPEGYKVRPEWSSRLEQSFSRSFTTAHLDGLHHKVRSGGRGGHRGVLVGRVSATDERRGEVRVRLAKQVAAGDLVYLYTPWGQTEPVRVQEGGDTELTLRLHERVAVKDRLFRLEAADAGQLARDLVAGRSALRPVSLHMCLVGEEGWPAALAIATDSGETVTVTTARPLAPARTAALAADKARAALGALGGTPYRLGELEFAVADGLFLAVGDLKDLRRRAVAALDERRLTARRRAAASLQPGGPRPKVPRSALPAAASGGSAGPALVLMLHPGEPPLTAPGVDALCLDLRTSDPDGAIAAAAGAVRSAGLPLRARLPEILFDADAPWLSAVLALPWDAVYVRHLGLLAVLGAADPAAPDGPLSFVVEYPLQSLNGLTAGVAAGLAGRPPAAVVASPEASLDEIAGLRTVMAAGDSHLHRLPAVEVLALGRQQVLHTRDQLGRAEGLFEAPGPAQRVDLLLEDAKGYGFPADVDAGGTRLFNARVTNLAPSLDELRAAGVTTFLVVQSDLEEAERAAFVADGLPALAPLVARQRSTTGHLFRGVA
ncbi:MAG: U32 family peptidase [Actinobacteria bacterium]|nr:U32 family peptidase [Actinomycetota bacterium]